MGEVYKARDTRLDRAVAVKILSTTTVASADARERFEREAKAIAQLSHPHICALYDVGEAESPAPSPQPLMFLVMELLDGETLAARLEKGPLPLEQTLRYGIEIGDALDKAHRHGIVHRDLKPANVMVTRSGVKLLDFGLAKAAAPLFPSSMSVVDTAAAAPQLTGQGTIAGTLQYMAPEQLEGRPADARSDIFALGVVLYEMATGKKAFTASSPLALASVILHGDPPSLTSVNAAVPAALVRIVGTCLAKDPDERWQSAHDVGLQLAAIVGERSNAAPAVDRPKRGRSRLTPWIVAGVLLLLAFRSWLRERPATLPAAPSIRFAIPPPEGGSFSDTVETVCIALSPDGSQLAYVAADATGERRVWLRTMSAVEARPLAGTEGSRTVLWSPDGRSIAFFTGDKLKRLDLPDGAPVTLSEVPDVGVVGTWGDGQILFAAIPGGFFRVPTGGGPAVRTLAPDVARGEFSISWPWFLPDGRRFLYLSRHRDSSSLLMAEPGKPPKEVLSGIVSNAQYVDPGYLVYARDGTLLGQRFEEASARVSGEPFPIAEPVRYFFSTGATTFATSRNGVLVYQSHAEGGRLVWLDRSGRELGVVGEPAQHAGLRISPDGGRVLFSRSQPRIGTYDLYLFDVARGIEQRLTTDRLSEYSAVWLPGGRATIFSGRLPPHLFRKDLVTGAEEELLPPPAFNTAQDVSPDGKTLVFIQRTPRSTFDVWKLALDGPRTPTPLIETPFDTSNVRFSPDGRYIAFASSEQGRYEVFIAPYPVTGEKTRVSVSGGGLPRWSRDGHEFFYVTADRHFVVVPVRTTPSLVLGAPQQLFAVRGGTEWTDPRATAVWSDFDVAVDGKRFLAAIPQPSNQQPLTAVLNWPQAALQK
jgi:Tol biopolymer transport system component